MTLNDGDSVSVAEFQEWLQTHQGVRAKNATLRLKKTPYFCVCCRWRPSALAKCMILSENV